MTNEENIVSSIIKLSGSYAPTIIFDDWVTMAALEIASCTVLTDYRRTGQSHIRAPAFYRVSLIGIGRHKTA